MTSPEPATAATEAPTVCLRRFAPTSSRVEATSTAASGGLSWANALNPPKPEPSRTSLELPTASAETTAYGRAALVAEAAKVAGTPEGARGDTLNEAAIKIGHLIPHEVTLADAVATLRAAGLASGLPPAEVDQTLRLGGTGGLAKGMADPRQRGELPADFVEVARGELLAGAGEVLDDRPDLFADVAALLSGAGPKVDARTACYRDDGEALFYEGQVNWSFGDPESGKTWLGLAGVAEALQLGRRAAVLDLDHNGIGATITRLLMLGAPRERLADRGQFRYVEPDDAAHLGAVVAALCAWRPHVALVDSVGELLPLLGLSSNSPDDFTIAHARTLKPLARSGAAVIAIDHLAKNADSRAYGATGTGAKRRAVGGVSLRVSTTEGFAPGRGGKARLVIHKDRHGALRAVCPTGEGREVYAGTFILEETDGRTSWRITSPSGPATGPEADARHLARLSPQPTTVREVKEAMRWGSDRATAALGALRGRLAAPTLCSVCGEPYTGAGGTTSHPTCDPGELAGQERPA